MISKKTEMSSSTITIIVIVLTGALLFFIYILSKAKEIKTALLG